MPYTKFVTAAGIGALLTGWYLLPDDPLQSAGCGALPAATGAPSWVCPETYRKLSNATATDAVDTFLRRAGGASPDGAFRMLTDESQKSHAGFVTAWSPVLFADRVGDLAKVKGLNTYEVTYATYDGGGEPIAPARGKVASHVQTVQVLGPVEEPRIRLVGEASRGTGLNDEVEFMKTFPIQRMQTFNSTEGRSVAAPKVMPDQPLSLLCQVSSHSGWWSRTGWGWVRNADLRTGDVQVPGVMPCDAHNAS